MILFFEQGLTLQLCHVDEAGLGLAEIRPPGSLVLGLQVCAAAPGKMAAFLEALFDSPLSAVK